MSSLITPYSELSWGAPDNKLVAWTFDPVAATAGTAIPLAGTLHVSRIRISKPTTISNIYATCTVGGTGLSNTHAAIYQDGNLLVQSADVSTAFQTTGLKTIPVTPTTVKQGSIYVAFWVGASTTLPSIVRGSNISIVNTGLAATESRFGTANTGVGATAPATLGTVAASIISYWFGVS